MLGGPWLLKYFRRSAGSQELDSWWRLGSSDGLKA
jgi:hypothetical protein